MPEEVHVLSADVRRMVEGYDRAVQAVMKLRTASGHAKQAHKEQAQEAGKLTSLFDGMDGRVAGFVTGLLSIGTATRALREYVEQLDRMGVKQDEIARGARGLFQLGGEEAVKQARLLGAQMGIKPEEAQTTMELIRSRFPKEPETARRVALESFVLANLGVPPEGVDVYSALYLDPRIGTKLTPEKLSSAIMKLATESAAQAATFPSLITGIGQYTTPYKGLGIATALTEFSEFREELPVYMMRLRTGLYGEGKFRDYLEAQAKKRKLDYEKMDEYERLQFIADILPEEKRTVVGLEALGLKEVREARAISAVTTKAAKLPEYERMALEVPETFTRDLWQKQLAQGEFRAEFQSRQAAATADVFAAEGPLAERAREMQAKAWAQGLEAKSRGSVLSIDETGKAGWLRRAVGWFAEAQPPIGTGILQTVPPMSREVVEQLRQPPGERLREAIGEGIGAMGGKDMLPQDLREIIEGVGQTNAKLDGLDDKLDQLVQGMALTADATMATAQNTAGGGGAYETTVIPPRNAGIE